MNKYTCVITLILTVFVLNGCATNKVLQPINGSKADGTVKLAYEYGLFEDPVVDWNLAAATAKQRCVAWGYKGANSFGGSQNVCLARNGYGNCIHEQVNVTYQCTNV